VRGVCLPVNLFRSRSVRLEPIFDYIGRVVNRQRIKSFVFYLRWFSNYLVNCDDVISNRPRKETQIRWIGAGCSTAWKSRSRCPGITKTN